MSVCLSYPMLPSCLIFRLQIKKKKHKWLCILWPSSLHNIKHTWSLLSPTLLLGISFFSEADACHIPSFCFCVSPFLWGRFDYVSPLFSYWYSSLFPFSLEKLASFDVPGKTTKRGALTVFFSSSSLYLFLSPPTLCFLLFVLNSSHSISLSEILSYSLFSVCILYSFPKSSL